jgi:predicted HicB family RNase H-like nuclease
MSDVVQTSRKPADAARPERRSTPRHRLVIEVSPDLHRRIVTICATRGQRVNEAVREVLERSFPS